MHSKSRLLNALSILVILTTMLSSMHLPTASAQRSDGIQRDYNAESGKVTRITGQDSEPIVLMGAMSSDMTSTERSDVLVERFAPEFGLVEPTEELVVADESQPEPDRVVTKYQQVYEGVPVMAGELIVNASDEGALYSMNGEVAQGLSLDTQPAFSVETAIDIAKLGMVKWYGGIKEDYQHSDASLQIFDESLLQPSDRPAELVWKLEMSPVNAGQPIRELVLVSAKTGNIPLHFNQVDTAWHDTKAEPIVEAQGEEPPTETPTPEPTEPPVEREAPAFETTPMPTETPSVIEPTSTQHNEKVLNMPSEDEVSAAANTWYVDVSIGNDTNTCSLPSPCKSIQKAINVASTGDSIYVAEGTYYRPTNLNVDPTVMQVNKGLTISGGWENSFTQQTGVSVVDGQNQNNGILVTGDTTSIDRFVVQSANLGDGAGIYNYNTNLTVTNSTIKNNRGGNGAGIFLINNASLSLVNVTISNNLSIGNGTIYVATPSTGTVDIRYSTIAYNTATVSGGGVFLPDTNTTITDSILSDNSAPSAPNCKGSINISSHNIIDDTTGCIVTAGIQDQFNVDPKLNPSLLGFMSTHYLRSDSPAIDAGNSEACSLHTANRDERGASRPQGGGCDLGAVEYALTGGTIDISAGSNQEVGTNRILSTNLAAQVDDYNGNPIEGVTVTFVAPTSGPGGTFADTGDNSTIAITDSDGIAVASDFATNTIFGTYHVYATAAEYDGVAQFQLTNVRSWYVSPTGTDSSNCDSPAAPCLTIQKAVDDAVSGGTVYVAAGTYTVSGGGNIPVVKFTKNVELSGGWDTLFTAQQGFSTLDGQNSRPVVTINTDDYSGRVGMSRFIIRNGKTISYYNDSGGGIYLYESNLRIRDSLIINNIADDYGGGISATDSNIEIDNSTITGNTAYRGGGGIYFRKRFINPTININFTTIAYNRATYPNAASNTEYGGGGINFDDWGSPETNRKIQNSILAHNTASYGPNCKAGNYMGITARHAIIPDTTGCGFSSGGYSTADPRITPTLVGMPGHFGLLGHSPAIDAADPATCPTTDLRGVNRPQGAVCDIGSFEKAESTLPARFFGIIRGTDQRVMPGASLPINLSVYAADGVGDGVRDLVVTFTAPGSGASGTFAGNTNSVAVTTNAHGIAAAPTFTTNNTPGAYTITASAPGVPTLTFQATNILWLVSPTGGDACTLSVPHCSSIQAAIDNAVSGDTIFVEKGTYLESVYINKTLTIKGGWNDTFTIQDGHSMIDGEELRQNVRIDGDVSVLMDRFDILNGKIVHGNGAGILNAGLLTFTNGAIYNNSAHGVNLETRISSNGGGIYSGGKQLNLINVTVSNNEADTGGGLFISGGITKLNNVTITQNLATNIGVTAYGGGIENKYGSSITISNTIIAGNAAEVGPDCYNAITSNGFNLIGYNADCTISPAIGDLIGDYNPLNAGLGDLEHNNADTKTHALLSGSPAIDAGNPATCATSDQRGMPRPHGDRCDIGAVEGAEVQAVTVNARTYSAESAMKWPGELLCDETQANCTDGVDPAADQVQQVAIGTHNFYLETYGRRGIDDNNMPIISTVHYCSAKSCPYYNALWTGTQMVYGDGYGFANADDVATHELAHGVTQYESNLYYFYQSGAINESFSDLWGEYYDQINHVGNDQDNVKWLIGEDVTGSGAFRSMKHPPLYGDPDRMMSTLYNKKVYYDENWDNGGVHSNSGVNNKAIYLMVDGGTFNNKTVTSLGWEKVGAIYYEVNSNLLTSGSDYSDLYYALQQACHSLIGEQGITHIDCVEVKDAVDAVQMNSQPVLNFTMEAPSCPTGLSTSPALRILHDDFEKWTGNLFYDGYWHPQKFYAKSGVTSMWGSDAGDRDVSTLYFVNGIKIPVRAATFLSFNHAFGFDSYQGRNYDGGVLEYFVGEYDKAGEAIWHDAKPLFSAGQNYRGVVFRYPSAIAEYGSPIQGRSAFVGDSQGYVSSRYNLSSLAGKTVMFRWVLAVDWIGSYQGWFIDDVQIYRCVGTPSVPALKVPASNVLLKDYTPLLDWSDASSIDHYELQVATDSAFTSLVYNESNVPASQFEVPTDLDSNTKYYWRVRGVNGIGQTGKWTAARIFRTVVKPPLLVSPATGSTVLETRPRFDWDAPGGLGAITGYTIQISKNNTFTQLVHTGNPVGTEYVPTVDLPKNTLLFWRVLAKGANGPSLYSEVRSLTTPVNPPPAPILVSPINGSILTTYANPILKWKPVTFLDASFQHYQVQLADSLGFSNPLVDDTTITSRLMTQLTTNVTLTPNTKYYWRVRAVNMNNEVSNWSAVWTIKAAILPPTLLTPSDDATGVDRKPLLDWDDVAGNTGYVLQIWKAGAKPTLVKTVTLPPNVSQYTFVTFLLPNTNYFWKVQTKSSIAPSAWSQADFKTGP